MAALAASRLVKLDALPAGAQWGGSDVAHADAEHPAVGTVDHYVLDGRRFESYLWPLSRRREDFERVPLAGGDGTGRAA